MRLKLTKLTLLIFITLGLSAIWSDAQERYRVQNGDDLGLIGKKYGVPFQEIMAANNLKDTTIFVGQELLIPTKKRAVTSRFNPPQPSKRILPPTAPIPLPQRATGHIPAHPTKEITDPRPIVAPHPVVVQPRATTSHYRGSTYVVERGDTVRSVSKKFGVAFWDLRTENDLWLDRLTPGTTLKIPTRPSTVGVAY